MAIALADVGKSVREILYGTPKEGTFTYDQKVTYSTKTADGVVRHTLGSNIVRKTASTIRDMCQLLLKAVALQAAV